MFVRNSVVYRGYNQLLNKVLPYKRQRYILTILLRKVGLSNKWHWSKLDNLHGNWEDRTKLMAEWIPPNSSVLEFGCGKMALRKYLPDECRYIPSDIVTRNPDTLLIDLNQNNYTLPAHDVFFFSGVVEYVVDLQRLMKNISTKCKYLIISYAPRTNNSTEQIVKRRTEGWVNDYSKREFCDLIIYYGFELIAEKNWKDQSLFLFSSAKIERPETLNTDNQQATGMQHVY